MVETWLFAAPQLPVRIPKGGLISLQLNPILNRLIFGTQSVFFGRKSNFELVIELTFSLESI